MQTTNNGLILWACLVLACGPSSDARNSASSSTRTITPKSAPIPFTPIKARVDSANGDAGDWTVDSKLDPMDEITNVYLDLSADGPLNLPFPYNDDIPMLVIRCKNNHTDLYVVTHTPVETVHDEDYNELGAKVRYRFDGSKPTPAYWSESTDRRAIFAPDPTVLAKRLSHTSQWLFEFTPFESVAMTATFHTGGLSNVLPKVATACHWK